MIRDMGDKSKDLLISAIMGALAGLGSIFPLPVPFVIHFVVLFSVLFHGQLLGKKLFPKTPTLPSVLVGSLVFLALFSLVQTAWFYLGWRLDAVSDVWSLLISIALCQAVNFLLPEPRTDPDEVTPSPSHSSLFFSLGLIALGLGLLFSVLWPAWKAGTNLSIRTPWPFLPIASLGAIASMWCLSAYARFRALPFWICSILDASALACTTLVTVLVYRIGFGFDGFLHIASEQVLSTTGFLQPKPFYYIGQYVLTTWLSRFSELPLATIDRLLVPIACAILLPFGAAILRRYRPFAESMLFALFPVTIGIATTPQAFAYIIGIFGLILSLGSGRERIHPFAPLVFGIWAIAIHPLAGIPLFLSSLALCISSFREELRDTGQRIQLAFAAILALLSGLAVPSVFFLLSLLQGTSNHWDFSRIFAIGPWNELWHSLIPDTHNFFVLFVAWASLISSSLCLILLLIAFSSLRKAPMEERRTIILLLLSSGSLLASFAILRSAGDFAFLIDYERGNYADRLLVLATVMAFFAAVAGIKQKISQARKATPWIQLILLIGIGAIGSGLAYTALPRHDALVVGRGWSVGKADLEAVRFIDRDAGGMTYGVLANQSVSAAAVSQFGFKRYAANDVFYYPIPTGGPLYEQYLRLTYRETTLDPIKDAALLTEASRMYVVINDYWWQADQLVETLNGLTPNHWSFGDMQSGLGSRVDVYRFDLQSASNAATATSTR